MTDRHTDLHAGGQVHPHSAATPLRSLSGYLMLGNSRIYQHFYGPILAGLLVHADGRWGSNTWAILTLAMVVLFGVRSGVGAADDLGGFRDGSDARNYAGRSPLAQAKKPLLTGSLTERQARNYLSLSLVVILIAGLTLVFLAGYRAIAPGFVSLLLVGCGLQYSTGLKLSYRPGGLELVVFAMSGAVVLIPYWVLTGTVTASAAILAALFGLWFVMVICYSNAADTEGDRAVGRRTMAVMLTGNGYDAVLVGLYLISVALVVAANLALGFSWPVLLGAMTPVLVLHAVQLGDGLLHRNWRRARMVGLSSVDVGSLGLIVAFALSW